MCNSEGLVDDDGHMKADAPRWSDRQVEALVAGRGEASDADLVANLRELRQMSAGPVPEPSSALTAVLTGLVPLPLPPARVALPRTSRVRSTRHRLRIGAVAFVAALGVTTVAAAANALPVPAQRAAAHVLNMVTPFHFPAPQDPLRPATPSPGSSTVPGPHQVPAASAIPVAPSTAPTQLEGDGVPEQAGAPSTEVPSAPEPLDQPSEGGGDVPTGPVGGSQPNPGQEPQPSEDAPSSAPASYPSGSESDAAVAPAPTSSDGGDGAIDTSGGQ